MKILLIHADFIEWEPKTKAIKSAEDVEKKKYRVDECLVVFSSVEKQDEGRENNVIKNTVKEVESVFKDVKAKNIVVYPYVHLSSNPSKPDSALKVLVGLEKELKKKYDVYRAPFGWYKAFDIKCKGHPMAELSREITSEDTKGELSSALKKEETMKSYWYIMDANGNLSPISIKDGKISGYDFSGKENLEKFARYEMAKSRLVKKDPPHIKLMQKLSMVSYEPGSDPGNLRYMPKGKLVKALIEECVTKKVLEYGAIEVETPIMYDYEHPALKKYMNRFPARQYTIETPNKKVFLRFAACFGQFLLAKDASISYKNLPLRMYELTKYSFRVEQRGEIAGLRRLRAFTMPDCHALCKDVEQAKKEMLIRLKLAKEILDDCNVKLDEDLEAAVRVVKNFYEDNKDFVKSLVKKIGKPVLIEMWDKQFFYYVLKYDWNFVDCLEKAAALTTDQIDVENGKIYGLEFTDKDNTKKHPVILHLSPSGAIERVMYTLLEKAHMEQEKGKHPILPLWLSPTQVRICPVSDAFLKDAEEISKEISEENIRIDIDDRTESIGKKIRDAEMEWVPLIVVIGEKEKKSGKLAVRFRKNAEIESMNVKQIIKYVKDNVGNKPFRPLPLPKLLTKRPVFV